MREKIKIIYVDEELVVCHKMPGIPVQTPRAGQKDMVSLLRNYFSAKGEDTSIFVVHRLDQPVEGLIVFARSQKAAAELSRQSREHHMDKCYMALAEGIFETPCGVMEHYLLRDGKANFSRVVSKDTPKAKLAKLSYEVKQTWKEKDPAVSLVCVKLESGRHHQIRVQMMHAGHPLVGDKKYNPNCQTGYLPVGLCSIKIGFCHPKDGRKMEFMVEPQGEAFQDMSVDRKDEQY